MADGLRTSMYVGAFVTAVAWALPAGAVGSQPSLTAGAAAWVEIANCVAADDKVAFRRGSSGAMLDTADHSRVSAAIVERYPMLGRDGLYPSAVAVWRRPGGNWLYATLIPHPELRGRICFSANVTANGLAPTPSVLRKYFGTQEPM